MLPKWSALDDQKSMINRKSFTADRKGCILYIDCMQQHQQRANQRIEHGRWRSFVANRIMALGRRPKAREHLIFLYTPHAVRIHTKIGTVNFDFGGALFRSTTQLASGNSQYKETHEVEETRSELNSCATAPEAARWHVF